MLKNFFKTGFEFNEVAKSMNGMRHMIADIKRQLDTGMISGLDGEVFLLAYIARVTILDRLDMYNWPPEMKISVPAISNGRVTLAYAMMLTVGQITFLSNQLDISDEVANIMDKGTAFYELQNSLPQQIKDNIK